MEKRKLASDQYVHHITPIEGADRIECVHVLGWQCVANKGQFKVGDHCIYMEVDSFLPVCEQFEFLRSNSFKKSEILGEGFRWKTLNFRGQISQGLVQPLSILPEGNYELGDDVTALLGIKKWEVEERVTNSGTVVGDFPDGIPKTDELRVQSYPELIEEFKAVKGYYISTKMDGTSVTMYYFASSIKVTSLYKVKLMKLMWYADALSYKRRGLAITGLVYQALPMGAVSVGHNSIIDLKDVPCEEVDVGETNAYHFSLSGKQTFSELSGEEKDILDVVIEKLGKMSKNEILNFMHKEQAYVETAPRDIIQFKYAESLQI